MTQFPIAFGDALVLLGVLILVLGIGYHVTFVRELRKQRSHMKHEALIYAQSAYPISLVLIVAVLLLGVGILAFLSTMFHLGPFSN